MNYFFVSFAKDKAQGFGNLFYATPRAFNAVDAEKDISFVYYGGLKVVILYWKTLTKEEFENNASPQQVLLAKEYSEKQ